MKRAQLMSADAIIALLIIFVSIGACVNLLDSSMRSAQNIEQYNPSEFASNQLATRQEVDLTEKCFIYSNSTNTCRFFSCETSGKETRVARRLVDCLSDGYCLLEVRSCV